MKKIIKFLFDFKLRRSYHNTQLPILFSRINSQIEIQIKERQDFPIKDTVFNSIFENILIKHLNARCEDISLSSSTFTDKDNKTYLKLFGDSTWICDDAKFILIKNLDKLNEDLHLSSDLSLSEADIYFILNSQLNFFELDNTDIYQIILAIIKNSKLSTIRDLKLLSRQILGEKIITKI